MNEQELISTETQNQSSLLSIQGVRIAYAERVILDDINFEIWPQSITSFLGASGVGKTTLLRALNRLLDEDKGFRITGDISLQGQNLWDSSVNKYSLRRCIGIIFQKPVIYPISISKNVLFGVQHLKLRPRSEFPEIVERYLREVFLWDEVKDRLNKPGLELSVGQQQRLAIARTLAVNPSIILMDEPTSALDSRATQKIEELLLSLKKEHTIILVTHDVKQALKVSDQVVCLELQNGIGRVAAKGSVDAPSVLQFTATS